MSSLLKYFIAALTAVLLITTSSYAYHGKNRWHQKHHNRNYYYSYYNIPPAFRWHYFYVRGGLLINQTEFINSIPTDRSRLGVQAHVGFIRNFSPRWGLGAEIGAGYYGRARGFLVAMQNQSPNLTFFGFDVAGVAIYRVIPKLWVRGRVGLAVIFAQPSFGSSEFNQTNTNPLFGVGIMYTITPRFSLTGDYTFVNGTGFITAGAGGSSITGISMPQFNIFQFGLEYRF